MAAGFRGFLAMRGGASGSVPMAPPPPAQAGWPGFLGLRGWATAAGVAVPVPPPPPPLPTGGGGWWGVPHWRPEPTRKPRPKAKPAKPTPAPVYRVTAAVGIGLEFRAVVTFRPAPAAPAEVAALPRRKARRPRPLPATPAGRYDDDEAAVLAALELFGW